MKGILCILLITIIILPVHAQNVNFNWAKQMGGPGANAQGGAIAVDASGNVYTTGYFSGTVDFDPGAGVFNMSTTPDETDIFITKFDAAGNFLWAKQMGGLASNSSASCIVLDALANIYIIGTFNGMVDFDPGATVFNLNSAGNPAVFISKLNTSGNFIWAKQMSGTQPSYGTTLALDVSGNIYFTGSFNGTVDFDPGPGVFNLSCTGLGYPDMFVSKLDAAGNFIWAKQIGGAARDEGNSIVLDISGNAYVTGLLNADKYGKGGNIFISKLDPAGNIAWTTKTGGGQAGFDFINSMAIDLSGNIYITGMLSGPGVFTLGSTAGDEDIFVAKLNAQGNLAWAKQTSGPGLLESSSIAVDASGNIYTSGVFGATTDFDPSACVFDLSPVNTEAMFVSKLNTDGNFIWAKQIGGPGALSGGMAMDATGNIYTIGDFTGTIDFDPGASTYNLSSIGSYDIFVQKMSPCTNSTSSTVTLSACGSYTLGCTTYTTSGVYKQTLINAAGCDSMVTLNLTIGSVNSKSTIDTIACNNIFWKGQTLTTSGAYTDTLINAIGCDSVVTLQLTIQQKIAPDLGGDKNLCPGDTLILYPGQFSDYLWQDGSTQSHYAVNKAGLYTVNVSNICGSDHAQILINETECGIFFPSAFTPNHDGRNETFKILHSPPLNGYELSVYNRWGMKVFETKDYSKGWDGYFNGRLQDTGVYVWFCKLKETGKPGSKIVNGTVILIR